MRLLGGWLMAFWAYLNDDPPCCCIQNFSTLRMSEVRLIRKSNSLCSESLARSCGAIGWVSGSRQGGGPRRLLTRTLIKFCGSMISSAATTSSIVGSISDDRDDFTVRPQSHTYPDLSSGSDVGDVSSECRRWTAFDRLWARGCRN